MSLLHNFYRVFLKHDAWFYLHCLFLNLFSIWTLDKGMFRFLILVDLRQVLTSSQWLVFGLILQKFSLPIHHKLWSIMNLLNHWFTNLRWNDRLFFRQIYGNVCNYFVAQQPFHSEDNHQNAIFLKQIYWHKWLNRLLPIHHNPNFQFSVLILW